MRDPLVSIVVTNYNYASFLGECLRSVSNQTYEKVELIVVDDGSTDNSREIIHSFEGSAKVLFKENGGMVSAVNAAFPLIEGEIICFLDADDALFPNAVQTFVQAFRETSVVEVDWPLKVVDEVGIHTGKIAQKAGHAWARWALEMVFPLPKPEKRYGIDGFLWTILPLVGEVRELDEPLGIYRWHSRNWFANRPLEERVRIGVEEFDFYFQELENWSRRLEIPCDLEKARGNSWFHMLAQALEDLEKEVPQGSTMVLVDEDHWCAGPQWAGRKVLPFLEREGKFWGLPENDQVAVRELERMMVQGARYVVFSWSTFWWLDYYKGLASFLERNSSKIVTTERVKVFHLHPPKGS